MAKRDLGREEFSQMFGELPDVEELIRIAEDEQVARIANKKLWDPTPDGTNRYIIDLTMRLGVLGVSDADIILLARIAEDRARERYQQDRERSAYD